MKKISALIIAACLTTTAYSQQSQTREVGSFSGVKAAEGIDVYLKKGDKEAVEVVVDGTDPSNIITEVSGSYLKVHRREGRYRNIDAKVYVTYVNLDKLSASSAGNIFSEGTIEARTMEISVSSAGSVEVTLDAGSVEVSSSSAGDVELKGKVRSLSAEASSAGEIDAYDLEADEVEAVAASAGSVKLSVKESLEARASTAGSIRYRGNPDRSNTNSSSGGSVKKSN
jgi:hypothetical protein